MKIVFMGTPAPAVKSLERILADGHEVAAVYTQPDRAVGRHGSKRKPPPVKEFALEHGLDVIQPTKVRTPKALRLFKSHAADVAVVVAYGRILPEGFLHAFPHGAVNVHFSLLPKYRGAAPVNWAIVNGEKTTGVTTMKMDTGLDTGDMLLQRETEIGERETAPELMERLSLTGAELLAETLSRLDSLIPIKQDDSRMTLAPIMKKEDGVIDWTLSARQIGARARGFQPFPTAYTFYQGKRLIIWDAEPDEDSPATEPGEVVAALGDRLAIACGNETVLRAGEVQLEGKRRMRARDLLNGVKIQVGEKLG